MASAAPAADDGKNFRLPALVLALLSLTAGFADGYALTQFDVFVANQSGNVVRLGMAFVGEYSGWSIALLSLLGFTAGAMLSWSETRWSRHSTARLQRLRLMAVALLILLWLVVVVGLTHSPAAGPASAFIGAAAMGAMAAVITKVAGAQIQPTYQTGNITHAAEGVLDWLSKQQGPKRTLGRIVTLLSLTTLACYLIGGALGAVGARIGPAALVAALAPVVAALILVRPGD